MRQLEKSHQHTPGLRRRSAGLEKEVSWSLKDDMDGGGEMTSMV